MNEIVNTNYMSEIADNIVKLVQNAKAQYIPRILSCFHGADLSKYKDSMRPLIEKDMEETERLLTE